MKQKRSLKVVKNSSKMTEMTRSLKILNSPKVSITFATFVEYVQWNIVYLEAKNKEILNDLKYLNRTIHFLNDGCF